MKSKRLFLRKWQVNDAIAITTGLNDIDVSTNFGTKYPYTIDDAMEFINDAILNNKDKYAVVLKDENLVIGGCGVHKKNNVVSGSLWITKEYQGLGYGMEACTLLVQYCFDNFNISKMNNTFVRGNIASEEMQKKMGATLCTTKNLENDKNRKEMVLTREAFERFISSINRD